jgi:hypothetical protein
MQECSLLKFTYRFQSGIPRVGLTQESERKLLLQQIPIACAVESILKLQMFFTIFPNLRGSLLFVGLLKIGIEHSQEVCEGLGIRSPRPPYLIRFIFSKLITVILGQLLDALIILSRLCSAPC